MAPTPEPTLEPPAIPIPREATGSKIDQKFLDFERLSKEIYDLPPHQSRIKITEFAEKYNFNLDAPPSGKIDEGYTIYFSNKTINPEPGIDSKLSEKIKSKNSPDRLVIVLQFKQPSTMRQLLEILNLNVWPFFWANQKTLVAQIDKVQVASASKLASVRWIGEYEPIYKYEEEDARLALSNENQPISVVLFPLHRSIYDDRDLEVLGVRILSHTDIYGLQVPSSAFRKIADIPWVKKFGIAGQATPE